MGTVPLSECSVVTDSKYRTIPELSASGPPSLRSLHHGLQTEVMAPAQGKPQRAHIVRSGNAGNSSKPNPSTTAASTAAVPPLDNRPPPLFPPGAKTPLKLLQERCSHNGWEKPSVESVSCTLQITHGEAPQSSH